MHPSMVRLKPCTIQEAIQEVNQKERNGKKNTTTKTKMMGASAKEGERKSEGKAEEGVLTPSGRRC